MSKSKTDKKTEKLGLTNFRLLYIQQANFARRLRVNYITLVQIIALQRYLEQAAYRSEGYAIARYLICKHCDIIFYRYKDLLEDIRASYSESNINEKRILGRLKTIRWLFIDDLGTIPEKRRFWRITADTKNAIMA
ncbi:MAG: hypothetical protein A2Y13_08575 [Planctomycetes bacterium GWC2_45_44]|nr:MAG: hypothetical protein A2Y13_08575 [Planctomycetes bacterium GWC2_45_44]